VTFNNTVTISGNTWNNATGGNLIVQNGGTVGSSITLRPTSSVSYSAGYSLYVGAASAAIGDGSIGFWNHTTSSSTFYITQAGNATLSGILYANGGNSTNWNTAYGWGDHATRGYLTSHPTIAGVSSNNSGRTYIQDILTDSNGHITGITTATETVVNTDTNYYLSSASFNTGDGVLTLNRSGLTSVTVDLDGRYLTSYTESDTLSSVVSRGNSTSSNIRVKRPTNKVDNNGNPIEFGGRVEFNNDFVSGESGYMAFRYPTYNNFLIAGDYDGNIGGAIPNIQFGKQSTVYIHMNSSNGYTGYNTTTPQKRLDVYHGSTRGIFASFGSTFSPNEFGGIHFGYSESGLGNDSYKKSALVFERTDNHGQGGNASGRIHFLLNNRGNVSADSLTESVMVIDTDASATQGSARVTIGKTGTSGELVVNGTITATGGNSTNWNTAYGWGNHATQGYLKTYTDTNYYTTGSTFNSGTGILTFTRNDGGNYTVNIAATLTDVTVTGGTYNSSTQTLRLTKSNGTTVDVSGFAIDTDVNWYTNSATFNTGDGVITGTRNDGGTWTVDIDGRYAYASHNQGASTITSGQFGSGHYIFPYASGVTGSTAPGYTQGNIEIYTDGNNVPAIGFHRGGYSATSLYEYDGQLYVNAWTTRAQTGLLLSSGNIGSYAASTSQGSKADTAYGWGNHASAGYLTTYTDTNSYTNSATFNTGNGIISFSGPGVSYSVDIDGRFLTSYTETDPIYTSERDSLRFNKMVQSTLLFSTLEDYNKPSGYSTMIQPSSYRNPLPSHGYYHILGRRDGGGGYGALLQSYNGNELFHGNTTSNTVDISWYKIWTGANFSQTEINNWGTAYGWGNHASAGYITGYTEVDTLQSVMSRGASTSSRLVSTLNVATGIANNSFNTSQTLLGNIHIANGGGASGNNYQGAITFQGDSANAAQAGIYVSNNSSSGTAMGFATTDSYGAGPKLFMTASNSGVVNFPRAVPTYAGTSLVYNSGTWGINITGNAATATNLGADYTADDWFRATGDNNPVKLYGNTYQMTFRTDGVTEAYSGIGGYPFVWTYNGSSSGNRLMLLDTGGALWTSRYGFLQDAFLGISNKAADANLFDGIDSGYYVKSGAGASVTGWLIDGFRNGSGTSPRIYMSNSSGYGMHINTYNTSASVYALEIHNNAMTTFMVYNDGDVIVGKDLEVTGDLKMQGTDSYIWTPNTATGFTGFWDQYNSRIAARFSNNVGWGFLGDPESGYAIKSHGSIRTTGSVVASGSVNSGNNFYADANYGYGLVGLYSSTRYQGVFAMGESYKLSADGTTTGSLYGIAWTHSNVGGQSISGLSHQMLIMENGFTSTAIGQGIWTKGNININNSTSHWFKNGNAWFGRNHAYDTAEIRGYGSELMIGSQGTDLHINYRTCNYGTANHTPTNWYWRAGSSTSYSNHFFGEVRAQSFVTVNGDRIGSGTLSVRSGGAGGVGWGTGLNLGDSSSYYSVIQDVNISRFRNYGGGGYQWFNSGASVAILELTNGGDLLPYNGVGNLGSSARRWANIYTNDLHLSNEGKVGGNDVDGTTGSWTIQEGSEDLYLINNKNGKKYKISLSEV